MFMILAVYDINFSLPFLGLAKQLSVFSCTTLAVVTNFSVFSYIIALSIPLQCLPSFYALFYS